MPRRRVSSIPRLVTVRRSRAKSNSASVLAPHCLLNCHPLELVSDTVAEYDSKTLLDTWIYASPESTASEMQSNDNLRPLNRLSRHIQCDGRHGPTRTLRLCFDRPPRLMPCVESSSAFPNPRVRRPPARRLQTEDGHLRSRSRAQLY